MLDYKDNIMKRYSLGIYGGQIASSPGVSKSGVNDFLRRFDARESLSFPLPKGTTNYWLSALIIDKDYMCQQVRDDSKALYIKEKCKTCPTEILEAMAVFNAEG